MKTSLAHLPADKQADIARIVLLIRKFVAEARERNDAAKPRHRHAAALETDSPPDTLAPSPHSSPERIEKLILFGSHARGDWVFDHYVEDGITYEYVSDYDVLVVTDDSTLPHQEDIWEQVRDRFAAGRPTSGGGSAGLSLITHTMKEVSSAIADRRYFFMDILKDGVLLHEAPNSAPFAEPRELSPQERKERAQEEFERWFNKAADNLKTYDFALKESMLLKAAFELHQATESLYITACMVFTDYRPKLHDLYKLRKRVGEYDRRLLKGFAFHTPEQKRLFKLLADAYVHARYTKTYAITKEELDYLAERARRLQAITEEVCREQLATMAS